MGTREVISLELSKYSESSELLVESPASISLADRLTDAVGNLENAGRFRLLGLRTDSPLPFDDTE